MYSQVLRVNIQPGKMDEGIAIFKDSVAPAINGWSGLQMGRLLVDRAGNKIMAVSFWDSQADEASLQSSSFLPGAGCQIRSPVRWPARS